MAISIKLSSFNSLPLPCPCRYDVRNRLDDKSQFGVKSNLPYKMSAEEEELEDQLDRERYLALHWDDIRVEEQEGQRVGEAFKALYLGEMVFEVHP